MLDISFVLSVKNLLENRLKFFVIHTLYFFILLVVLFFYSMEDVANVDDVLDLIGNKSFSLSFVLIYI